MNPVPLSEAQSEEIYGGKAAQLARALGGGLPVPEGFALSASFVDQVAAESPVALRRLRFLLDALPPPLAVRSSAVGEDSERTSFAGLHRTFLNVRTAPELIEAVQGVHRSAEGEGALAYRHRMGVSAAPRIGVVVQRLVDADVAGVLFTQNPLDGADERVIEAAWGLGESVVQGSIRPDRYRMSRDGRVLERSPGVKDHAVRPRMEGGTAEVAVAPDLVESPCLDENRLERLNDLALRCERLYAGTQDLEWAFSGDCLYLLQRRPITVAPH